MVGNSFFNIFAASPIKPLQKHMELVTQTVSILVLLVESAMVEAWPKVEEAYGVICKNESQADELKKEIRLHLPTSLFMPVSRSDILQLLTKQDKIANRAKDIAGLILGRRMTFPSTLQDPMLQFVKRSADAAIQANTVIHELDSLLETAFKGHEVDVVEGMIEALDGIETETDALQIALRRGLFEMEKTLNPIDVMFLYRIFEMTGALADDAQRVGHRLQQWVAHW